MGFDAVNRLALRRLAGRAVITPPGGQAQEVRALYARPYDGSAHGEANTRRSDPEIQISDEDTVTLERGSTVQVWDVRERFVGDFTLQRSEPDDDHTGLIRITLRQAQS